MDSRLLLSPAPSHQELHQVVGSGGGEGGRRRFCHFEGGPLQQHARGAPACLLDGLQSVLNAAARLICNRGKYDNVMPLLRDVLHCLPVPFRIEYKLCLLVFPPTTWSCSRVYLRDCCVGTHSSESGLRLRSLMKTDLRVRRMRTHFGDRAFSAAGPRCWNSLPPAIRLADSRTHLKCSLKLTCSLRLLLFSRL